MSTRQAQCVFDNSSLANFKQWAQFISASWAAAGWVQTADTGQVNWGTIPSVPSGANAIVYEIWRMADALQSTSPIFMRVEYGQNSASSGPNLRFVVGTATDGAGTVQNGTPTIQCTTIVGSSGSSNFFECDFCWLSGLSSNSFALLMWRTHGSNGAPRFFCVERGKDANGNEIGDYTTVMFWAFTGMYMVEIPKPGTGSVTPGENTYMPAIASWAQASGAWGGGIVVSPVFPIHMGAINNPMSLVAVGKGADFAEGSQASGTLYGATRNYLATKAATGNFQSVLPQSANFCLLMRYD